MSDELERARAMLAEAERALGSAEAQIKDAAAAPAQSSDGAFRDAGDARLQAGNADLVRARRQLEAAQARLSSLEEDPLTALAARGKEREARSARDQQTSAGRAAAARGAAAARRRALACTPWGFLGRLSGWILVMTSITAALWAALFWWFSSTGVPDGQERLPALTMLAPIAVGVLGAILVNVGIVAVSKGALAREQAWQSALPFPLEGYEEMLGKETVRRPIVVVSFTSTPADLELLRQAAVGCSYVGAAATGSGETGDAKQLRLELSTRVENPGGHTWRPRVHRLVEELLLPAHQRDPISSVKIGS